ncbi:helix-turn-helix domain-containing protein [Pectinatus brassicae]|uniref:Transcriptional regulator with XRE-family HTH domain n=1 Tax=Pectinatus brassicae TaxID=862415 RepID=A0A840UUJ1_9FIRM|nr:helix-turn-helix transcriptional regulator [Pectinatus brassicae]MBB5336125.1 transcriptional regulator with XRE-family HTH domain [Pectinatus brassicae]
MAIHIDNKLLGIKISYYRKRKGYTQYQLAERINISQSYMAKIECGFLSNCVSLGVLNNIANELEVSIDKLISLD